MTPAIRPFVEADRNALIALWQACELTRPWNDPGKDIDRKLADDPSGLVVMEEADALIGAVMVGYEGHRGWVNYLAVHPDAQGRGLGRVLMEYCEAWLLERDCPKLNLQIRNGNDAVIGFYESIGYSDDNVVSMGRRLIPDD